MHLKHNDGKSVVLETFITTLKIKIYKYMASILKNVYVDKLGDTIDEYNNPYHNTKIFAKGYAPNWFKEVFVIKEVIHTVPWAYVISDLNPINIKPGGRPFLPAANLNLNYF